MFKKALVTAACAATLTQALFAETIQTQVNGRVTTFPQAPVMVGDQVMVPMRALFESLEADVQFAPMAQTIRATRGNQTVHLTLGSPAAMVGERSVTLATPARVINGSTMVPLRFVAEALGADVRWVAATKTVIVDAPVASASPTVQVNTVAEAPAAPKLTSVTHSATGTLRPGDRLTVTVTGDPGADASFQINGLGDAVVMREISPGTYQGEIMLPETALEGGTVLARLKKDGQEASLAATVPVTVAMESPGVVVAPVPMTPPVVGAPGSQQSLDVTVTNLEPGNRVPDVFAVEGKTVPFGLVKVTLHPSGPLVFGAPEAPPVASTTARANENGDFDLELDATAVPLDTPMKLTLQAVDSNGNLGTPRTIEVIRD